MAFSQNKKKWHFPFWEAHSAPGIYSVQSGVQKGHKSGGCSLHLLQSIFGNELPLPHHKTMFLISRYTTTCSPSTTLLNLSEISPLEKSIVRSTAMSDNMWLHNDCWVSKLFAGRRQGFLKGGQSNRRKKSIWRRSVEMSHDSSHPFSVMSITHHHGIICCSSFGSFPHVTKLDYHRPFWVSSTRRWNHMLFSKG